jgi:hypothetical protein
MRTMMKTLTSRALIVCVALAITLPGWISAGKTDMATGKPGWSRYSSPEEAGFSSDGIARAKTYFDQLQPAYASSVTVYKGKLLIEWGKSKHRYWCHSVRKSFLSALIGIHVHEGDIDMNETLAELGIDDNPPLTEAEKQARVVHLIKSRSGVYHEAAAETPDMEALRPPRGSHEPGEFWYYNNWDFNALGTIFRQETGKDIFQEFKDRIADPIGMQDYRVGACRYEYELNKSIHPAYAFRMSARDRARFGQLFLDRGNWNGEQVVPAEWVKKSTRHWSDASMGDPGLRGMGYGYMWRTWSRRYPPLAPYEHLRGHAGYAASGYMGHAILIIPSLDMVHVVVPDSDRGYEISFDESARLLDMILDAKFKEINDLRAVTLNVSATRATPGTTVKATFQVFNDGNDASQSSGVVFYLSKDAVLSVDDLNLGSKDIGPISPNGNGMLSANIAIPRVIQPRAYHLIAVVDPDDRNEDPVLENNIAVSQSTITVW